MQSKQENLCNCAFLPITGRKDQSWKIRDEIKRIDNAQLAFFRETIFTTSPEMPEMPAPGNNEIRVFSTFCCWTFSASIKKIPRNTWRGRREKLPELYGFPEQEKNQASHKHIAGWYAL